MNYRNHASVRYLVYGTPYNSNGPSVSRKFPIVKSALAGTSRGSSRDTTATSQTVKKIEQNIENWIITNGKQAVKGET